MSATTPAGWYPDPEMVGTQRYWDGAAWTEHRAPARSTDQQRVVVVDSWIRPIVLVSLAVGLLLLIGYLANQYGI